MEAFSLIRIYLLVPAQSCSAPAPSFLLPNVATYPKKTRMAVGISVDGPGQRIR